MDTFRTAVLIGLIVAVYIFSVHAAATVWESEQIEGADVAAPYIPNAAGITLPILVQS